MLAAYNHFISVGFIENGAGAAVGNFCQESGEFLIATMFRAHPDYSGGVPDALKSGGIAEWLGDRKTAYIAFAGRAETRLGLAKGSLLNDLGTQCDFVVYELQTNASYATLYQQLTSGTRSIPNLTANFMMVYERPKLGPTANLDNRIEHAQAVVAKARLLKATPEPQQEPEHTPPLDNSIPPVSTRPLPAPSHGPPPISASAAGRHAAVLDNLDAMLQAYLAERATIDKEIAILETTISDFGKLASLPSQPTTQIPVVEPAVNATQRNKSMPVPMVESKPALASTGVWGGLISSLGPMVVMVLNTVGSNGGLSPQVSTAIMGASGLLGGLLAIYGRVSATAQITGIVKS